MIFYLTSVVRNRFFPIVLIAMISLGCEEKEEVTVNGPEIYEDWIKLTIPDEREAFAVFGDIDRTLAVATWYGIYYTQDGGENWQMSPDSYSGTAGLLHANDTLFALQATTTDSLGNKAATLANTYSLDTGQTWHRYNDRTYQYFKFMGTDTTSLGTVYEIRKNVTNNYVNPSSLLRSDGGLTSPMDIPFNHHFYDVYIDQNDRLYIAAAGDQHNPEDNTLVCCYDALIYVSREPTL